MPCGCNNVVVTSVPTCKDCLVAKSVIVPCSEGVQPCGGTFSVDLKELIIDTICGADGSTTTIDVYDTEYLTNVAIDGDLILTGEIVGGPATAGVLPSVTYRTRCVNGLNSGRGKVQICVANPCANVACPTGQHCDGCTGDCVANDVNVLIQ